jgi:hypothetical protein
VIAHRRFLESNVTGPAAAGGFSTRSQRVYDEVRATFA